MFRLRIVWYVSLLSLYFPQHSYTAAWLAEQPGMVDITASRKTLLQITTTTGDDGEEPKATTVKGGRQRGGTVR